MRAASAGLQAHLSAEVQTLAYLWTVIRRDGSVFGFTNHDRDIVYGGTRYAAATGFSASSVEHRAEMTVGNLEIAGFLNSASITESDLTGGKWDGATVEVSLVNYSDLTQGDLWVAGGEFGEVALVDGRFAVELKGLAQKLQTSIGRVISPHCDAIFCDSRCGLTVGDYTVAGAVTGVTSRKTFNTDHTDATGYFSYGLLTFTSGANEGVQIEVAAYSKDIGYDALFSLVLSAPYDIQVGDTISVVAGCDKTFNKCAVFNNTVNFRGFPHVPGTDRVLKPQAPL